MTKMSIENGQVWDNKDAPGGAGNTTRGLARSSGTSREGIPMKGTRTFARTRRVTADPHPDYAEAVTVSRFWRLVSVGTDEECWLWSGDTDRNGYGIFTYHGTRKPAHEMALSFTVGEKRIQGMDTCHSCDTPACCNPSHLRFDTRQSNVDDMHRRGRGAIGERAGTARLTEAQIVEIRVRRANGARQIDLAAQYGLSGGYVSQIVNGIRWSHVGGPITGNSKKKRKAA